MKISTNIKNYMKAYKAYEKSYNEQFKKCTDLADKFNEDHPVGVVMHLLLVYAAIYAVMGGIYMICFYGIPWICEKIQEKKNNKEKENEENENNN